MSELCKKRLCAQKPQIKVASDWSKWALKHHPDKKVGEKEKINATKLFQVIRECYEQVLRENKKFVLECDKLENVPLTPTHQKSTFSHGQNHGHAFPSSPRSFTLSFNEVLSPKNYEPPKPEGKGKYSTVFVRASSGMTADEIKKAIWTVVGPYYPTLSWKNITTLSVPNEKGLIIDLLWDHEVLPEPPLHRDRYSGYYEIASLSREEMEKAEKEKEEKRAREEIEINRERDERIVREYQEWKEFQEGRLKAGLPILSDKEYKEMRKEKARMEQAESEKMKEAQIRRQAEAHRSVSPPPPPPPSPPSRSPPPAYPEFESESESESEDASFRGRFQPSFSRPPSFSSQKNLSPPPPPPYSSKPSFTPRKFSPPPPPPLHSKPSFKPRKFSPPPPPPSYSSKPSFAPRKNSPPPPPPRYHPQRYLSRPPPPPPSYPPPRYPGSESESESDFE